MFKNMFKYITYKTGKKHILYFFYKNKKGNKMEKKTNSINVKSK